MTIGVYLIENVITGQFIVGSTNNLSTRRSQHFSYLKRNIHTNPHLQSSWNKHGETKFKWTVVKTFKTLAEARKSEQFWIDFYWNYAWNDVYNMNKLASGGCSVSWSKDRIQKFSNLLRNNNPMCSALSRQRVSQSKIGKKRPDLGARNTLSSSKEVAQLDKNGTVLTRFSSVREASKVTGYKHSGLYNCCNGLSNSSHGYIWRYL